MRPITAPYPATRLRRLRATPMLRDLVAENSLTRGDLIWPIFLRDGVGVMEPIASMPGVFRRSVDMAVQAAQEAADLGIPAICLFPYTDISVKTLDCAEAWNPNTLTNRAIRAIKSAVPGIAVMTDVALDPYNANGHDGFVRDGVIVNDETIPALVRMALDSPIISTGCAFQPGYFLGSTMKALTPLAPTFKSVLANSTPTSVSLAMDAHIFCPVMR